MSLPSVEAKIVVKRLMREVISPLIKIVPGDQLQKLYDLFKEFVGTMPTSMDFPFSQVGDDLIALVRRICVENQLKETDITKNQYQSTERRLNTLYFESIMQKDKENIPVIVLEDDSDTAPETVVQTGNGTELQAVSVENIEDDAELEAGSVENIEDDAELEAGSEGR
jgi:hypothetical protein